MEQHTGVLTPYCQGGVGLLSTALWDCNCNPKYFKHVLKITLIAAEHNSAMRKSVSAPLINVHTSVRLINRTEFEVISKKPF